jgi:hypothetical protein
MVLSGSCGAEDAREELFRGDAQDGKAGTDDAHVGFEDLEEVGEGEGVCDDDLLAIVICSCLGKSKRCSCSLHEFVCELSFCKPWDMAEVLMMLNTTTLRTR